MAAHVKAEMTEEQRAQHDSDVQELLALYIVLLSSLRDEEKREEALYALAELRVSIAFRYVASGLGLDVDTALQLLQNIDESGLTDEDKELRARLVAAIDNLIDFSVCEEYQLYDETSEMVGDDEITSDSDDYEELIAICKKYNDTYSAVENSDIEYAGAIAAAWLRYSPNDYLVYWTQNDVRVRPWHLALQGYTAPRDEFPSWMIPPIEYNCRCFLEILETPSASIAKSRNIKGLAKEVEKPEQLSNVFSESLAKCGRIFGPAHSYFTVKERDKQMLQGFVERLRDKYYGWI